MSRFLPPLLLAVGAFLCYGGGLIRDLGFYHDDWFFLSQMAAAPADFISRMIVILHNDPTEYARPVNVPLWAALYTWFGAEPLGWQAALLATHAALAWCVYAVLRRFESPRPLAFLGALAFLAYPSKDSTLFWCIDIIHPSSLLCYLAAYLLHLRYVETGRLWALALSALGVLLALGNYDQCVLLFPVFLLTPVLCSEGVPRRVKIGFCVAAAASVAFVLYKTWIMPHVLGVAFNKKVAVSPFGAVKVYLAGLNANFGPRLAWFSLKAAAAAVFAAPLTALAAVLLPWAAVKLDSREERADCSSTSDSLAVLGGAVFVLGYLPIALSSYIPTPLNHQNRLNLVPALGAVLFLLGCLSGAPPKRLAAVRGLAGLCGFFLLAHGSFARVWAESTRRQREIQGQVVANARDWSVQDTLLLRLPERYVQDKAPVFDSSWDITGAVRVWLGDPERVARVWSPRMKVGPEGITEPGERTLTYDRLVYLDAETGRFGKVSFLDLKRMAPVK